MGHEEGNDQNPVDANHVAENNNDDDDCEENDDQDTWYHFAPKRNTTEAEKKQRMKRDGHVGLFGLVVGVLIGYLVGSKRCCCCCQKKRKRNTVSGELVVLGSITPSAPIKTPTTPSAPITSTSEYSANAIV